MGREAVQGSPRGVLDSSRVGQPLGLVTGPSAEVAFSSQIFAFKSMGIGLLPKLPKYLESGKKRLRILTADFH